MTEMVQVRNPYSGETDYSFAELPANEVIAKCEQLRSNQLEWGQLALAERVAVLEDFAASIARHSDALTKALIADTGRRQVSVLEVNALGDFVARVKADAPVALAAREPQTAHIPFIQGSSNRVPYGLVGNISPWNFPVILSFLDTFPALVSGNAVIIKPSEVTPRWVEPMLAAINDCPEIAKILDIVPGTGKTGALINQNVDAVVFTGSVPTGRKVGETAARQFIPSFLELGGKDPAIVLESADIDMAARTVTFCSVQSTGQACQSLERVYVARSIYDEFVDKSVQMAAQLQINFPDIDQGVLGPFIFENQAAIVMQQLAEASGQGARILCGGELLNHGGFWMKPTVVTDVTHDMRLMQEETFGPVMPIMAFDSVEEAIALANDSQYGLSAAIFAGTVDEGRRVASRVRAGAISVNDAALTAAIHEFTHDAFGLSGLGASRAGMSAYTRFTREQSVMANVAGHPLLLGQLGS